MADTEPKLTLHRVSGKLLEVRADEILAVQKQSALGGARALLSRTNEEGCDVQVAAWESAEAITRHATATA
jgi:hypothetical protein